MSDNQVCESQWSLESGSDICLHQSDMEDRHIGISIIGNETCFSLELTIDEALQLRDELSRITTDVFRADHSIRCPCCGYSWEEANIHLDHRICRRYPFFPDERGKSQAISK